MTRSIHNVDALTAAAAARATDSYLTKADVEAITKSATGLTNETLNMTGHETRDRLDRIEQELRRMNIMQEQIARLKAITKSALLGEQK
jgi:hypothetical protein